MRCVFCEIETKKQDVDYKEYGVSLGKFPAMVCPQCKEIFFDAETAKKIQIRSKEKGFFGLSKKVKVGKIGGSLMIRIPKEIAKFVHLKEGKEVRINPSGNNLVVES